MITLGAIGLATFALTWGAVATSAQIPDALGRHLALYVAAGVAWAIACLILPSLKPSRRQLGVVIAIAIALRVPAWLAAPVHSDDVHRYLWDGHVQRAGVNPYLHPPDAPALERLRDDHWARLNHRHLPTIYPPLAQLSFRLARALPGPPLVGWKLLVGATDLGMLALLMMWLRRRGGDARAALAWGWSPLVAIELGQNAHVDGIGALFLVAALVAIEARREVWAGIFLAGSTAIKLLAAALLPGLRRSRLVLAFALTLAILSAPFVGPRMMGSLGEYGRRWRSNDGAFSLLYMGAERAVAHTRFRARLEMDGRTARLITGRERDTVFPDEAASFFARVAAGILYLGAIAVALLVGAGPVRLATVAFGAFMLLTPTLHPWYVVWMVPLVAAGASSGRPSGTGLPSAQGSPAWIALAALAPLGYEPLGRWLSDGKWQDATWTRALEHGLPWAILVAQGLIRRKRPLLSSVVRGRDR